MWSVDSLINGQYRGIRILVMTSLWPCNSNVSNTPKRHHHFQNACYFLRFDIRLGGVAIDRPIKLRNTTITVTSWWARWRLKSPAPPLYNQPFIQDADQRNHQSSASLAFVRGIHLWPMNSPHNGQWCGKRLHLMTSSYLWKLFMYIPEIIHVVCALLSFVVTTRRTFGLRHRHWGNLTPTPVN